MTEIWLNPLSFYTASQRLADQAKMILKKGWFSDLEILEIYQLNREEYQENPTNRTETLNTEKPETH